MDKSSIEKAFQDTYDFLELGKIQKFIWTESPFQGVVEATNVANDTKKPTKDQIKEQISKADFTEFGDNKWSGLLPNQEITKSLEIIQNNVGTYWTFESVIVLSEKSIKCSMVNGKLHNKKGFALEYKDGTGVYALNGSRLTEIEFKQMKEGA